MQVMLGRKIVQITLIGIILFALSGCSVSLIDILDPGPTPMPRPEWLSDFLQNPVCQPPCWENMTPGETNVWDASSIISSIPDLTNITGPHDLDQDGDYHIGWNYQNKYVGCGGGISSDGDGIVQEIRLGLDCFEPVTISEVLGSFPGDIYVFFATCPEGSCFIYVYILDYGIKIALDVYRISRHQETLEISKDKQVDRIDLFPAGREGWMKTYGPYGGPDDKTRWIPWHGYGEYEIPWIAN